MLFPYKFIALQFDFATKVSHVLHVPFIEALFEYTSMPVRVGVPFSDMTIENERWRDFTKLVLTVDDLEKAFAFHKKVMQGAPPMRIQFGCFSYDYLEGENLVKLHFANNDSPVPGALSDERVNERLKELKSLFKDVKRAHPEAKEAGSSSWLYNVEAFKRLFPKEFFLHNSIKWDFRSLGIWGQFLDKQGNVKKKTVSKFKESLCEATSIDMIKESFPLKEIKCWSGIEPFYEKYRV